MALAIALASLPARDAHAEDLFEIRVFHAEVTRPNAFALELHSNYVAASAREIVTPEHAAGGVLFQQLEPSFGIARRTEIAVHFRHTIDARGVDWGGVVLRGMTLLREERGSPLKIGVNVEGGYTPPRFVPARWGAEIRPVLEWNDGVLDIDLNPVVSFPFGGEHACVPVLQPSLSARVVIAKAIAPGVEYYADIGPVSDVPPLAHQRHYAFATADVIAWPRWLIHFGAGVGLTPASSRAIVTVLLGHDF